MTRNILILPFLLFLTVCSFGQKQSNTYEIKIGKYSFQTRDLPQSETEKSYTLTIKLPTYIQKGESFNADGISKIEYDTINHFTLTKLMDSISLKAVSNFINTEIEVFSEGKKLKVERISVMPFRADGKPYNTNYESNKISGHKRVSGFIKKCPPNSYIVLDTIWFYTLTGEKVVLSDKLGWKIIK